MRRLRWATDSPTFREEGGSTKKTMEHELLNKIKYKIKTIILCVYFILTVSDVGEAA